MPIWLIILLSVVGLLILLLVYNYSKLKRATGAATSPNVIHLTDNNFQQVIKQGSVLVDFWADWCMPCKLLGPTISQIADEYQGKVKVGKLNVEEAKRTASKYGVSSIPTVILFKNGKESKRFVGVKPKHIYTNHFDE
ncbi:MAG: thioredoxin [Bacteroidetes bacterium HGW-Bacteroidetes-6]|nr:MAG: thioredoxin [Bacteroidetes bacterium HGW-Bacteroidetes-6]